MNSLAADVWKLYEAGKETLPAGAAAYAEATTKLGKSGEDDVAAFQRSGYVGPGVATETAGQVYPAWAGLRNDLLTLLGASADHLRTAGRGLVYVSEAYAQIDKDSADRINKLRNSIDDKSDDIPPVTKPKELYT